MTPAERLRALLAQPNVEIMPGCYDGLSAKLVAAAGYKLAFITAVVGRLLGRGLIHKQVDPRDRRRVTLTVSAKGRAALERLAPLQRQVNDVEFSCLSRQEFELLTGLIDRLIDSGARAVALQNYLQSELAAS